MQLISLSLLRTALTDGYPDTLKTIEKYISFASTTEKKDLKCSLAYWVACILSLPHPLRF